MKRGILGLDSEVLAKTVADYNAGIAAGEKDPEFGRGEAAYGGFDTFTGLGGGEDEPTIAPFDLTPIEAPYYGVRVYLGIINSQGGPKRDATGNIVDLDEKPIPRLYGAGEMGTVYAYNYNGGGNVSVAVATGRLAARSVGALEPWA